MSLELTSRQIIDTLKAELNKAKEAARYWELMATTDDLTGLHNRRMLNHVQNHIHERRTHMHQNDITLLFIDLDDFGQLNKKYGDDVGDDALRLLGKMIQENIRETDLAIRKGGDEFVLFLMGTTPEIANKAVVKRLEMMLDGELSLTIDQATITIRGSIGVFSYDQAFSPLENLKKADALMRKTKKKRKSATSSTSFLMAQNSLPVTDTESAH